MKTLREVAQILERSSVKQIAKDLELKAPVSLRQILKFEFIDPQKLRNNIVAATQGFKAQFGCDNGCTPKNTGKLLNESQVNSFFTGSPPWRVDCLGAARIIMARGLIQTLKPGEFDKLGYTSSSMHLDSSPVASIDQMMIGDWGYIRNDWRYLQKHPGGAYQGENVIKVSASMYYGFPLGTKTYAQWVQALINAYNSGLPPSEHINSIPGFQGNSNITFDVRTINLNVWKLRKP